MDFDLTIGDIKIPNPLVLASIAGLTNSSFAITRSAGLAILGGYNLDEATITAAKELVKKGRSEFAYDDPMSVIKNELGVMNATEIIAGVNARSATLEPLLEIAELTHKKGAILELNAHCRQLEMEAIGAGQCLMRDLTKLSEWIREIKQTDVPLSVKVRAGVIGDVELAIGPGRQCELRFRTEVDDPVPTGHRVDLLKRDQGRSHERNQSRWRTKCSPRHDALLVSHLVHVLNGDHSL
jgi:TIM-barrel protein